MVTGPIPRKPNATNPNAKTASASINFPRPCVDIPYDIAIKPTIPAPSQRHEKLPATKPERMFREAPPSRLEVTISLTCFDEVEVNTFTSSGINAPAKVPQEMIVESCHQRSLFPDSDGIMTYDTA